MLQLCGVGCVYMFMCLCACVCVLAHVPRGIEAGGQHQVPSVVLLQALRQVLSLYLELGDWHWLASQPQSCSVSLCSAPSPTPAFTWELHIEFTFTCLGSRSSTVWNISSAHCVRHSCWGTYMTLVSVFATYHRSSATLKNWKIMNIPTAPPWDFGKSKWFLHVCVKFLEHRH